jgi:biotin operon repressor
VSHRTPETEARKAAVAKWLKAREALGTRKKLARELGVTEHAVESIIARIREERANP